MRLTVLYSDNNPSDFHRLLLPLSYLDFKEVGEIKLVNHKEFSKPWWNSSILDCDILWFSRVIGFDWLVMEEIKKKYGFKIIVDFDDYYKLSPHQLRYNDWEKYKIAERMITSAKNADLILVTGEQLYKVYREFNKNILIIPNALPFVDIKANAYRNSDRLRFIYVAGKSHYNDFKTLTGLFKKLHSDSQFNKSSSITFCGHDSTPGAKLMESVCKSLNGSYVRRNLLPLDNYLDHYDYGDVSIAPLVDNLYNNVKSNLKFIEAARYKLPLICSEVQPYLQDYLLKNKAILFCNKTSDWYKAFKFFMNNPEAINDYGEAGYQYAEKNYNLANTNQYRIEAFKLFVK